jgi:dienelactone hydrolase
MITSRCLPDLLVGEDGQAITSPQQWPARRAQVLKAILDVVYGGMPPVVKATGRLLGNNNAALPFPARYRQYQVQFEGARPYWFRLDLLLPPGQGGHYPVIISGDGCWRYYHDQVELKLLNRGYALALFSRVELIPDVYHTHDQRTGGLYDVFPDHTFGAIAAWAWGYHRCIDVLETIPEIDSSRIAVTGHSRGGKTALLAGATDERIALTNANNSGCCGAGSHHFQGPGAETIDRITTNFPFWFARGLAEYARRDHELPVDQHMLKAAVAPRALLTTEALGDLWANPQGTWRTHQGARPVYELLGAAAKQAIYYRPGRHAHLPEDFQTLLDFMDWQFKGIAPSRKYNVNPFAGEASA